MKWLSAGCSLPLLWPQDHESYVVAQQALGGTPEIVAVDHSLATNLPTLVNSVTQRRPCVLARIRRFGGLFRLRGHTNMLAG